MCDLRRPSSGAFSCGSSEPRQSTIVHANRRPAGNYVLQADATCPPDNDILRAPFLIPSTGAKCRKSKSLPQAHAQTVGLRGEKGIKKTIQAFRLMPMPVSRTAKNFIALVLSRSNEQVARPVGDGEHCVNTVNDHIDDHLLQMDPIAEKGGKGLVSSVRAVTLWLVSSRSTMRRLSLMASLILRSSFFGLSFLARPRSRRTPRRSDYPQQPFVPPMCAPCRDQVVPCGASSNKRRR